MCSLFLLRDYCADLSSLSFNRLTWTLNTCTTPRPAQVMTEFLPTVMDDAAAKQLREQKKMQLLEERIREAARAQLAGAKGACMCVRVCM